MEGVEQTKVKHTHRHTLRLPLNINLYINNENHVYKIGAVCVCEGVLVGGGRVKKGD
jgi:hypothetical protein